MTTICQCGRPTSGAWLCDDCGQTLAYAFVNVGVYSGDLDNVLTKRTRYGVAGAKGSVGKVQPLVVDGRWTDKTGRGSQLSYDVRATVVAWCRVVMDDQAEMSGPVCEGACLHISCAGIRRRRYPSDTIASMVHYLARQFRHILSQEWAPDVLDEMLDLERRLVRMVDRPAARWYAGKCSATDESGNTCTAELYATAEKGSIVCPACETGHDIATRREFLLTEAKGCLVTATEAAAALMSWTDYGGTEERLVDRIRKWRDRDRLPVAEVTSLQGRDRHLYRLGDIQDLLVQHAQREQARAISA